MISLGSTWAQVEINFPVGCCRAGPIFGLSVAGVRAEARPQGPNHLDLVAAIASCGNRT
jgi:hypothetical protein